jgi:hypothetical protein
LKHLCVKIFDVAKLDGQTIVKWVATEMALAEAGHHWQHVLWRHPSVPYLQLISIDVQLEDGSVYRMHSQLNQGGKHKEKFGLYLEERDFIERPANAENDSIFRTRELTELPVGVATVTATEVATPDSVVRAEIFIGGRAISFLAAEVHEREGGGLDIAMGDESILMQVDGSYPQKER